MYNNGGAVTVETGATLVIEGNYTSSGAATIQVNGNVQLKGNFINNGGTVVSPSTGTLSFNGTVAQNIGGTTPTNFYCALEVNNTNGVSLNGANEVLSNALTLTNGKLTLNAYDLTLAAVGVTGASSSKYVVTNGAGQLKAPVVNANYAFPVGTSGSYNPLVLNEAGTADTYGVIFTGAMPGGWSGGTTHSVLGHWDVTEVTPGGNNLTATAQWNGSQEQLPFDRNDCAVGVSINNGGTVAWKASGAAAGSDPYTRSGTGFASVGTFMVADYFFEGIDLDLDVMLAGPYSGGTMSTALLAANKIPLNDPYGNSTTVASIPANTVDWIEVQLRDSGTPGTIIKKYSFFVDNNGNVLNTNGTVGTKLTGVAKASYYVAVKHRNHLGVMTASAINFAGAGPFAFDFSAGASLYGTNPMRNMGSKWALWAGDTDGNNSVSFGASPSDITPISNAVINDPGNPSFNPLWFGAATYSNADSDMNSFVQFGSSPSDITPVSASVLNNPANGSSNPLVLLTQQLP